jgi:agmatinase
MSKNFAVLPLKYNFLGIETRYSSFENSKIAIISCPYERTTSYGKGTRNGPGAILRASHFVEFFDEETRKEVCFEQGIAALKPTQFINYNASESLRLAQKQVEALIKAGKFVITLGGEHTISIAPIKAHFNSNNNLSILHFDAHSDLRMEYEGSKYSHACFAARVCEFTNNITQVGIRAQCIEEYDFIKKHGIKTYYAYELKKGVLKDAGEKIIDTLKKNVYITFDVDYFDPSIMPSTGTPEPGGFFWDETLDLMKQVISARNLIGFDVVELSPRKDFTFPDYLTAKLIYKILNYKF